MIIGIPNYTTNTNTYTSTDSTPTPVEEAEVVETVEEWEEERNGVTVTVRKKTTKTTRKPNFRSYDPLITYGSYPNTTSGSYPNTTSADYPNVVT